MATLELAVDARPMQRGAQEATQALDGVSKAAERTTAAVEQTAQAATGVGRAAAAASADVRKIAQAATEAGKSVSNAGASMRAAFQATGGSIQVAGGIAQTAKAFGELNIAAATFGSSRALLEIGKTVEDFRELAATVGKTGSVFQTLGAIIKANPLLSVATALGAVGSLMQVFTGQTDEAAKAVQGFNEELQKLARQRQAAEILGIAGPAAGASLGAIRGIAEQTTAGGLQLRPAVQGTDLAREAAGLAADILRQREFRDAFTEAALRQFSATGAYTVSGGGQLGITQQRVEQVPDVRLTQQEAQRLIADLYRQQAARAETEAQVAKVTADARKAAIEAENKARAQLFADEVKERQGLVTKMREVQKGLADERRARSELAAAAQFDAEISARRDMVDGMREYQRRLAAVRFIEGGGTGPSPLTEAAQSYEQQLQLRRGLTQQLPGAQQRLASYQARQAAEVPMAPLPPAVAPGQAPYYLGGAQATGVVEFGAAGPEGGALQESALAMQREKAEADRRAVEASKQVADNMQAAADYAGNIGGQLGSAFADVLMKTTTLRQAFSSIVASIARQSLADVGAGILRGAVGGMTARQTGQNVGVSP